MKRSHPATDEFGMSRVASAIECTEAEDFDSETVSFADWLDDAGHLSGDHSFSVDP